VLESANLPSLNFTFGVRATLATGAPSLYVTVPLIDPPRFKWISTCSVLPDAMLTRCTNDGNGSRPLALCCAVAAVTTSNINEMEESGFMEASMRHF